MIDQIFILILFLLIVCIMAIRHYLYSSIFGEYIKNTSIFLVISFKELIAILAIYCSWSYLIYFYSCWYYYSKYYVFLILILVIFVLYFIFALLHIWQVNKILYLVNDTYLLNCYKDINKNGVVSKRPWYGRKVRFLQFSYLNFVNSINCDESCYDYFEELVKNVGIKTCIDIDLELLSNVGYEAVSIVLNLYESNGFVIVYWNSQSVHMIKY